MGRIHVTCTPNAHNLFLSRLIMLKKKDQPGRREWEGRSTMSLQHRLHWVFQVLLMLFDWAVKVHSFQTQPPPNGEIMTIPGKRRNSPALAGSSPLPPLLREDNLRGLLGLPGAGPAPTTWQEALFRAGRSESPAGARTAPGPVTGRRHHRGQFVFSGGKGRAGWVWGTVFLW